MSQELRDMPFDQLAEQSVLGGVLLSPKLTEAVWQVVHPEDFYDPRHEIIAATVKNLSEGGKVVDAITVNAALEAAGKTLEAGGAAYVHQLTGIVPTAANAVFYAEIVKEKAFQRRLIEFGTSVAESGFRGGDLQQRLEVAKTEFDRLQQSRTIQAEMIGDSIYRVAERLNEQPDYTPTPWWELNELIGGLRDGALYIVGGRPGGGKSLFGLQLASAMAESGRVAFAALEMSSDQLLERMISDRAQIHMGNISRRDLGKADWDRLALARPAIERLPIAVDDRSNVTINDVKEFARSESNKGALSAVIVDYLQLISSHDRKLPTHEVVGEITRQLKVLARDLACPVVALSQLNRESVQAQGKNQSQRPPTLADLSKSDSIGHHADVVLLLQRQVDAKGKLGDLDVFVAKNRHGQVGKRSLIWQGHFARVVSAQRGLY